MATYFELAGAFVPVLLLILAGFGYLIRSEREHRRELEKSLNNEKREVYLIFVRAFYEFILPDVSEDGERRVADAGRGIQLIRDLRPFNTQIFVFGSDEVIFKYVEFFSIATSQSPQVEDMFGAVGELLVAIRKDMGWKSTKVSPIEFARMLLTDYDDAVSEGGVLEAFSRRYS